MGWWIGVIIVAIIILFAIVGQSRGWVDLRGHAGRGSQSMGGTIAGLGDELFHPTRYEVQLERDRQAVLPAAAPTPGDGLRDVYAGKVTIDLSPH